MLFPLPRICGSMFCGIAKGLGPTCTCIVLDLSSLVGSRELDRRIGVGVGVSSVFRGSSSIGTSLAKGMLLFLLLL
jgi:type IV secretory pathway VirB2 component (pilin)